MLKKWLTRLFRRKPSSVNKEEKTKQFMAARQKKRYEIMVFENDMQDNGLVARKPRGKEIAEAYSRQELIQLYGMCDQHIEFLNEYPIGQQEPVANVPGANGVVPAGAAAANGAIVGEPVLAEPIKMMQLPTGAPNINLPANRQVHSVIYQQVPKSKPKFYSVGGIDIKEDNGKIYQKQWIALSEVEAANLRVINDKNNKIVSLAGKHIEMKKWVLVEDKKEDTPADELNIAAEDQKEQTLLCEETELEAN